MYWQQIAEYEFHQEDEDDEMELVLNATYPMANLRLQNTSFPHVSTCATLLPFGGFFERLGTTWMLTRAFLYSSSHLALISQYSKGLDAVQTAFAVKKYKCHQRVGLPSEIMALMRAQHGAVGVPNDV